MDMGCCNLEFHALCDRRTTGVASRGRETVFTCLYPYTVQTRPLAGTASGMASDSVRGRGNICGADLEIKSKRGDGTLLIFEASA